MPINKMITQGYLILAEYNLVRAHHPPGIFVLPVADTPLIWTGFVSVRSGYYVGGIFRFRLLLAPDFPSTQLPRIFLPKGFYHPYTNAETGELSLSSAFTRWNPEKNHLWQILHHVRYLLTCPTASIRDHSAEQIQMLTRSTVYSDGQSLGSQCTTYPNPEAADLIINHRVRFEAYAHRCVKTLSVWSQNSSSGTDCALDNFPLSIHGWDDDQFIKRAREFLKTHESTSRHDDSSSGSTPGYSWIDTNTMTIFANEHSRGGDADT
ncbi:hypothetical protein P879_05852 [Paragonimus westermani]|uniref:UBC core domain-containing protein n=1 Tax=Paragonimus westermani TaxID=34504 RepID=A0A8T0DEA3_9TREM|nr:hypothetical protein P879_05852 [Paragonimus westermani]